MIEFDEQKTRRVRVALADLENAVHDLGFAGEICFNVNRVETTSVDDRQRRYWYELSLTFTDETWIGRLPAHYAA